MPSLLLTYAFNGLESGIEWDYPTNCSVQDSSFDDVYYGIVIANALSCNFDNIEVERSQYGLFNFYCYQSEDVQISNFGCSSWEHGLDGINIMSSERVVLRNASTNCLDTGIRIDQSSYVEIYNSSIRAGDVGVEVFYSTYCALDGSSISGDFYHVYLESSISCSITENTFTSDYYSQISIDNSEDCLIQDCIL